MRNEFPAGKRIHFSRLAGNLRVTCEPVRDCWRGIYPLKHESPHEMGVKEIEVPEGTEIGLNLDASAF
jgi:hypothetical protein